MPLTALAPPSSEQQKKGASLGVSRPRKTARTGDAGTFLQTGETMQLILSLSLPPFFLLFLLHFRRGTSPHLSRNLIKLTLYFVTLLLRIYEAALT